MRATRRWVLTSTALAAFILGGCASGPYVQPDVPRPGMMLPDNDAKTALEARLGVEFEVGSSNVQTKPISFEAADQYGRFLIDAYNAALQQSAKGRRSANLGSIWGGLVALGLEATDNGGDTAFITGLSASGLGISSRVLISPSHEAAYSLGARQVICVLSAATDNRPQETEFIRIKKLKDILTQYQEQYNGAVDAFEQEFPGLIAEAKSKADTVINQAVKDSKAKATRLSTADETVAPEITVELGQNELNRFKDQIGAIGEAYKIPQPDANLAADLAKSEVDIVLKDYDRLGAQLFNRIETIRMQVNDAVRRTEPDLIQLNDNLRASVDGGLAFANLSAIKSTNLTLPEGEDSDRDGSNTVTAQSNGIEGELKALDSDLAKIREGLKADLTRLLSPVTRSSDRIGAAIKDIEAKVSAFGGEATLRFPDNAFAACTGAKIEAIDRAPAIAIAPGSFALAEGYEGGTISTEITGGSAPYFVKDRPDGVSVDGSIVSVTLDKEDIKPGGQDRQFIITDTLGKATIFTIKQPPKPAESEGGGGDEVVTPVVSTPVTDGDDDADDTNALLTGDGVTAVQTALQSAESDQLITRLNIDVVNTYLSETDADGNPANSFVDGDFGPITRWVVQAYIDDLLDQDATALSQASCEASETIMNEVNDHSSDNNFVVYSQDAISSMTRQEVDEGLLSLAACLLKVPDATP